MIFLTWFQPKEVNIEIPSLCQKIHRSYPWKILASGFIYLCSTALPRMSISLFPWIFKAGHLRLLLVDPLTASVYCWNYVNMHSHLYPGIARARSAAQKSWRNCHIADPVICHPLVLFPLGRPPSKCSFTFKGNVILRIMWIKRNPWVIQKLYLNCSLPTFLTIVFFCISNN